MQPQPPLRLTSVDIREGGHPREPSIELTFRVSGPRSQLDDLVTAPVGSIPEHLVARLANVLGISSSGGANQVVLSTTDEERLRQWLWSGIGPLTTETDRESGYGLEFHRIDGTPRMVVKVVPR